MTDTNFIVTPDLYASKEKRFINLILDYIGYLAYSLIFGAFLGVLELVGIEGIVDYIDSLSAVGEFVFGLLIILSYFTVLESVFQRSIGKFITKTMVVLEDGSKPTFKDAFLRSLCRLIPFEAFSFLGSEGRGWHDTISDTYVVDIAKFKAKQSSQSELDQLGVSQEL